MIYFLNNKFLSSRVLLAIIPAGCLLAACWPLAGRWLAAGCWLLAGRWLAGCGRRPLASY
jgi:hypothetical protein